jgi:hypothetical protein
MPKPYTHATQQIAELACLYAEHAAAVLRTGEVLKTEGMGQRFAEEDAKASDLYRRIQEIKARLDL